MFHVSFIIWLFLNVITLIGSEIFIQRTKSPLEILNEIVSILNGTALLLMFIWTLWPRLIKERNIYLRSAIFLSIVTKINYFF